MHFALGKSVISDLCPGTIVIPLKYRKIKIALFPLLNIDFGPKYPRINMGSEIEEVRLSA